MDQFVLRRLDHDLIPCCWFRVKVGRERERVCEGGVFKRTTEPRHIRLKASPSLSLSPLEVECVISICFIDPTRCDKFEGWHGATVCLYCVRWCPHCLISCPWFGVEVNVERERGCAREGGSYDRAKTQRSLKVSIFPSLPTPRPKARCVISSCFTDPNMCETGYVKQWGRSGTLS